MRSPSRLRSDLVGTIPRPTRYQLHRPPATVAHGHSKCSRSVVSKQGRDLGTQQRWSPSYGSIISKNIGWFRPDKMKSRRRERTTVIAGIALLLGALGGNYLCERYAPLAILENSPYPVGLSDLIYPIICALFGFSGIVLILEYATAVSGCSFVRRMAIILPPTLLYGFLVFAIQALQTGADEFGECPGLDQAATSSNVLPEAPWRPGSPAVACGVQRRGLFLAYYNQVRVWGVVDPDAQRAVREKLEQHCRRAYTHPTQVMFYRYVPFAKERQGTNSWRHTRLVGIVNIR